MCVQVSLVAASKKNWVSAIIDSGKYGKDCNVNWFLFIEVTSLKGVVLK